MHALGECMHLCVFHRKYSHFYFKDLFVKDTCLTCWRLKEVVLTRPTMVPSCCAKQASVYPLGSSASPGIGECERCQRAPEMKRASSSSINQFNMQL